MSNVVVVGAQWGDEGKGKIVDWLSHRADVVVRFQGGHNAGHTLVVDGVTYKLSLMPSGVVQKKLSLIGNGVVVDPWAFISEIEKVREQGVDISPKLVRVADQMVGAVEDCLHLKRRMRTHRALMAAGGHIQRTSYLESWDEAKIHTP